MEADYEKIQKAAARRTALLRGLTYVGLSIWALIVLFPFYWMLLTSVKSYASENSAHSPHVALPHCFIGAYKAYSDAVALFGTDLNAAGMNTIVGYVYDMLYGDSGGYPSYASAAAILLFAIVLTITAINLLVSKKHVHY